MQCLNLLVSLKKKEKKIFFNKIFSLDYNNYAINRSYPTPTTYDYHHHHHPWEKANYATFHHQSPLFSTGSISSINKSYHPPSFDTIPNLNNTNPNFYRRHSMLINIYI